MRLRHGRYAVYKVNEVIIYGKMGPCRVMDITTPPHLGANKHQLYYVLKPLQEACTIYTPVNTKVFMRPVISAEEAKRLIDSIPSMKAEAYIGDGTQDLVRHYEAALAQHDCKELIKLTMGIYDKKQIAENSRRKLGQIDQKFMKQAEDLLFGELSIALGIPREEVMEYINSRVEALSKDSA